jgi:hypothetical protein
VLREAWSTLFFFIGLFVLVEAWSGDRAQPRVDSRARAFSQ